MHDWRSTHKTFLFNYQSVMLSAIRTWLRYREIHYIQIILTNVIFTYSSQFKTQRSSSFRHQWTDNKWTNLRKSLFIKTIPFVLKRCDWFDYQWADDRCTVCMMILFRYIILLVLKSQNWFYCPGTYDR